MKQVYKQLINAGMAGALVFLGACSSGNLTTESIIFAGIASAIIFVTQFKQWFEKTLKKKNKKAQANLFNFLNL